MEFHPGYKEVFTQEDMKSIHSLLLKQSFFGVVQAARLNVYLKTDCSVKPLGLQTRR